MTMVNTLLYYLSGLWDDVDGFYYDQVRKDQESQPLKIKSMVGLVPLFCTLVLKKTDLKHHPGFAQSTKWFRDHRKDLAKSVRNISVDERLRTSQSFEQCNHF